MKQPPSRTPPPRAAQRRPPVPAPVALPEVVEPMWILKALGGVLAVGLLCAYISVCVLFSKAQWQLVLHPSRKVDPAPASQHLQFEPVRFGDDAAGQPQLAGWWIPSDLPTDPTVLMLHNQDGSMSAALPSAKALHDARLNVLLFDYRGYGESGARHPTEQTMRNDAASALEYLTARRHLAPATVIVYGAGLGASLGVTLCEHHPELPALLLESADGDTETRVLRDTRFHILPLHLLFHERFPLADPLSRLRTPKLLVSYTAGDAPLEAERASDPKMTAELPQSADPTALSKVFRRFLDTYVKTPPPVLRPAA